MKNEEMKEIIDLINEMDHDTPVVVNFDFNYAGFRLQYGYEKQYLLKNEICLQLLFWTFYFHW